MRAVICLALCLSGAAPLLPEDTGPDDAFAARAAQAGDAPRRVVSTNLCTDQMAMLLAAPGQLVSVGYLSRDPVSSALAAEAETHPVNHGQAEEIAFLHPDLVLAGAHGNPATVAMLERLGIPVARFAPEASLDDIRTNLRAMGDALHRRDRAEELIALMDARLDALAATLPADRPLGAVYYSGGYTAGSASLAGDMLRAAGIDNLAERMGMTWGGTLALEDLVLARPDTIVRGQRYGGHSRGEEMLTHPVLSRYMAQRHGADAAPIGPETTPAWVCGTPLVATAIADLATLVHGLPPTGGERP